jgi:anti-anti-sigma regulatory factor
LADGTSIEHGSRPGWVIAFGCLDLGTRDELRSLLIGHPFARLDLSNVRLIDASIIGLLLERQRAARSAGGDLLVVGASGLPRKVLEITGAYGLLTAADPHPGRPTTADDPHPKDPPSAKALRARERTLQRTCAARSTR